MPRTFAAAVKRNAPPDGTVAAIEVAPLDLPKLGDATSAFRATTMLDMGIQIPVTQDFVFVFKADAVIRVSFLGAGQPFQPALQRTLVGIVQAGSWAAVVGLPAAHAPAAAHLGGAGGGGRPHRGRGGRGGLCLLAGGPGHSGGRPDPGAAEWRYRGRRRWRHG
ncbi:MAG: hypothetical protein ABIY58_05110 [Acidimicrobiales bacterium]